MAEQIENLLVFSSNTSKSQRASVTVRNIQGAIIARVYSDRSQPLRYLRNWINCTERIDLILQLQKAGVEERVINKILTRG